MSEAKPNRPIQPPTTDTEVTIPKPRKFDLEKFKSKASASIGGVETLLSALPHHGIAAAKDFVRLHPNQENYWSPELCFVNVPIKGDAREQLHLIDEDLAKRFLPSGRILRFRLALAGKPHDVFFLCHVPSVNLDNLWNQTNLQACEQGKTTWIQVSSRKQENKEGYKVDFARHHDAFPEPKWPTQTLFELIEVTFAGRVIEDESHPGLLRLIGARQHVS